MSTCSVCGQTTTSLKRHERTHPECRQMRQELTIHTMTSPSLDPELTYEINLEWACEAADIRREDLLALPRITEGLTETGDWESIPEGHHVFLHGPTDAFYLFHDQTLTLWNREPIGCGSPLGYCQNRCAQTTCWVCKKRLVHGERWVCRSHWSSEDPPSSTPLSSNQTHTRKWIRALCQWMKRHRVTRCPIPDPFNQDPDYFVDDVKRWVLPPFQVERTIQDVFLFQDTSDRNQKALDALHTLMSQYDIHPFDLDDEEVRF